MKRILILAMIITLVSLFSGLGVYKTEAATTDMGITMSAGTLTAESSASATLTGKTVSTSAQTSTGSIANAGVIDARGSGAGWTATMTSTHFTTRATQKTLAGTNDTVTFSGTYDGLDGVLDPNGTFKVEITTGGAVGTAVFKWWDPAGTLTETITTASTVSLSNGISVNFAAATYVVADSWSAGVDVFPYTGLTVTPGTITATSGSLTGVTAGSAEALAGSGTTSSAKTLMTAAVGYGTGTYQQNEDLDLNIHANSLAGTFTATATITVS